MEIYILGSNFLLQMGQTMSNTSIVILSSLASVVAVYSLVKLQKIKAVIELFPGLQQKCKQQSYTRDLRPHTVGHFLNSFTTEQ